jgi:riboflavin kinase
MRNVKRQVKRQTSNVKRQTTSNNKTMNCINQHDQSDQSNRKHTVQPLTVDNRIQSQPYTKIMLCIYPLILAVSMMFLPSPCFPFSTTRRFYHRVAVTAFAFNTDNEKSNSNGTTVTTTLPPSRAKLLPHALRYRGLVDEGYGRGGKKLGVPTANLPSSLFQNALEDVTTGVYFGWTALERNDNELLQVYKAVVNVGYSPTFEGKENKEKVIEAHLILEKEEEDDDGDDDKTSSIIEDFYGIPMRLQLIGFLREEKKFDSFPELIAQILADVDDARLSLDCHPYQSCRSDTFFSLGDTAWIGNGGGDEGASWESEPIQPFLDSLE